MPVQGREIKSLPLESESTVETVCLLSKLNDAKHHIEFDVSMEELGVTSAEAKATYEKIKNWVAENYEFSVTNLYIAQVKRKHGIIEHENYNQTGNGNGKVPQCPPDKEKAIEAALKHFQMI